MEVKVNFINSIVFALSTEAFVRYFEALVNSSFYFVADGVVGDLEEVYQSVSFKFVLPELPDNQSSLGLVACVVCLQLCSCTLSSLRLD